MNTSRLRGVGTGRGVSSLQQRSSPALRCKTVSLVELLEACRKAFPGTGSSWLVSGSGFWPRPDQRSLLSCLGLEGRCWHSGLCGRWEVDARAGSTGPWPRRRVCPYLPAPAGLRSDPRTRRGELHHQNRKVGAVFKVDPKKLHDICLLESTQQLAFLLETIDHVLLFLW